MIVPINQLVDYVIAGFKRKYFRNNFYGLNLPGTKPVKRTDFMEIMACICLILHRRTPSWFSLAAFSGGLQRYEKRRKIESSSAVTEHAAAGNKAWSA
jgi:hypothetical protein